MIFTKSLFVHFNWRVAIANPGHHPFDSLPGIRIRRMWMGIDIKRQSPLPQNRYDWISQKFETNDWSRLHTASAPCFGKIFIWNISQGGALFIESLGYREENYSSHHTNKFLLFVVDEDRQRSGTPARLAELINETRWRFQSQMDGRRAVLVRKLMGQHVGKYCR